MLQAVHTTKHLSTAAFFYIHTFLTNRLHALPNNRLFFGTLFFYSMHAFFSRNNYSAVLSKHWQKNEDSCNLFELRHSRMNGQQCFFSSRQDFFPLGRCIHKGISFYVLWYATKRARQRCQIVQTPFSAAARLVLPQAPLTLSAK